VGISAMFTNQIAAFFATLALFLVLFWLVGFPANLIPAGSNLFNYLSIQAHFFEAFNIGVINLSDIVYFLSLTALGLFIGTTAVEIRRWR
jgi:ABC-2 type transport system permease protein